MPERSTNGSELDVFVRKIEDFKGIKRVYLGFATEIPPGYRGILVPRSSATKYAWAMLNSPGVIDEDFRGEWIMVLSSIIGPHAYFPWKKGDRVGQIYFEKKLPIEFNNVDGLSDTERGDGGFGSTGNWLIVLAVRDVIIKRVRNKASKPGTPKDTDY